jgi:hypothetical protein
MQTFFIAQPQSAAPIEPLAWLYRSEAFAEDLLDDEPPTPPLANEPHAA